MKLKVATLRDASSCGQFCVAPRMSERVGTASVMYPVPSKKNRHNMLHRRADSILLFVVHLFVFL
jgi:hypothetical protein